MALWEWRVAADLGYCKYRRFHNTSLWFDGALAVASWSVYETPLEMLIPVRRFCLVHHAEYKSDHRTHLCEDLSKTDKCKCLLVSSSFWADAIIPDSPMALGWSLSLHFLAYPSLLELTNCLSGDVWWLYGYVLSLTDANWMSKMAFSHSLIYSSNTQCP